MISNSLSPRAMAVREAELSRLISHFTTARGAGDSAAALRFIDRAWRMAPSNAEINFLYGRQQLSRGEFAGAAKLLATAVATRRHPGYEAAYISALCSDGRLELARQRLEAALREFAIASGSELAQAARQVASGLGPHAPGSIGPGWFGIGPDLKFHGELLGQTGTVRLEIAGDSFSPITCRVKCAAYGPPAPFDIPTDGIASAHVTARVHDKILLGGKQDLPPDFGLDGRLYLSKGVINGWASLRWDPARPLELVVSGDNGFSMLTVAAPDPTEFGRQLFSFTLDDCADAGNAITVGAILPDGSVGELPAAPFLIRPPRPPMSRPSAARAGKSLQRDVTIVIPVYSGVEETLTCIRSVIATIPTGTEIVVIDDASPDRDMAATLAPIAATGAITLLRNPQNLGFPATANRGLMHNPDRDAILLNADTEVYGDWLDRLRAAAYGEGRIATVTPLTNSGSIATYPSSEAAELPSQAAAELDRLAAAVNGDTTVDIPTGVGFCLYIRRDCMDEVGYFDAETFSKGYGEENDFCRRATGAGWTHILAAGIYVRHSGSRSFGGRRAALFERNFRLLTLRHRDYDAVVQRYLKKDPAHAARRRLDEARLGAADGRNVLVISLSGEGGVARAVRERIAAMQQKGLVPVLLTPDRTDEKRIALTVSQTGFDDLQYNFLQEAEALMGFLRALKFESVELHHFLDLPASLIEQILELPCPVDIAIHDYVWYCHRVTLLDRSGRYCGEPDIATCQACIDKNGGRLAEKISVAALRARSARWLRAARNITVPSQSVQARMAARFPELTFRVQPLETNIPAPMPVVPGAKDRLKIALIGAIGDHKGHKILLKMATDAAKRDLPIEFVVIGFTEDDRGLFKTGKVFITGWYEETEVEMLIARENPDLMLFLSVFPESWCYSLTYALRAGIPVAAFDFGAIGDRLRESAAHPMLLPLSCGPAEICDRLLEAFHISPSGTPQLRGNRSSGLDDKSDILSNVMTPPKTAEISRTNMAPPTTAPTASVSLLPLTKGLFLFSVRSTESSQRIPDHGGISLPAMQIVAAPGAPAGQIEFMMSPQTQNGWLSEPNDQIVARVTEASALVLLTSVMIPGMTPLEIEVQRLGQAEAPPPLPVQNAPARSDLPQLSTQKSIRLEVTAHVQNHGDMAFDESQWAGLVGQGLWIESFSISPLEEITPDMIEYKAITSTGVETPWVGGGQPCGTRGIGVPLVGFALRTKPQPGAPLLTCEYGATLLSGTMVGPARNGVPCRSTNGNDPITAIWVSITGQGNVSVGLPAEATSKQKKLAKTAKDTPPQPEKQVAPAAKKKPIGPRFSVFREPLPTDQE